MRGTVNHWGNSTSYGFVSGEDGREYVLEDSDLIACMQMRPGDGIARANGHRVGLRVAFEPMEAGANGSRRWCGMKNVFVLGGEMNPSDQLRN